MFSRQLSCLCGDDVDFEANPTHYVDCIDKTCAKGGFDSRFGLKDGIQDCVGKKTPSATDFVGVGPFFYEPKRFGNKWRNCLWRSTRAEHTTIVVFTCVAFELLLVVGLLAWTYVRREKTPIPVRPFKLQALLVAAFGLFKMSKLLLSATDLVLYMPKYAAELLDMVTYR